MMLKCHLMYKKITVPPHSMYLNSKFILTQKIKFPFHDLNAKNMVETTEEKRLIEFFKSREVLLN